MKGWNKFLEILGPFQYKRCHSTRIKMPIRKITWFQICLIFKTGIPIHGKVVLYWNRVLVSALEHFILTCYLIWRPISHTCGIISDLLQAGGKMYHLNLLPFTHWQNNIFWIFVSFHNQCQLCVSDGIVNAILKVILHFTLINFTLDN